VAASTLYAIHDVEDSAHAMPLITSTMTPLSDDRNMFWISYGARIWVMIGLASYLVIFGRMGRVDKPVILRSICNRFIDPTNTSKVSVAPIQIVISKPASDHHDNYQKSKIITTSPYSSSKVVSIDTTLHTIIECSEDEEDTDEEYHSCKSMESSVEITSGDNEEQPQAQPQSQEHHNQQEESNISTLEVTIHQLENITTANSTGNTTTTNSDDESDSYELSSILTKAIIQGRSRKTMLKLARRI
jgi:hypothetical protein